MEILILSLCTHIWDPHKLSAKQIIGHIASKKKFIMYKVPYCLKNQTYKSILSHMLTREIFGVLLESLQKRGKNNRAQIYTWNNVLCSLMSEKPNVQPPSDSIPRCIWWLRGFFGNIWNCRIWFNCVFVQAMMSMSIFHHSCFKYLIKCWKPLGPSRICHIP